MSPENHSHPRGADGARLVLRRTLFHPDGSIVIFIVVKFTVRPEEADTWLDRTRDFTEATRSEPGNLWFEWSRSLDDPNQFVLVEAFRDSDAGAVHVGSEHFRAGLDAMRPALARTPQILNTEIPGADWAPMGELDLGD